MSMHLHLDPVGGIAGNMLCAALIELGANLASIQAGLDAIGILDVKVSTSKVKRGVFAATHFDVSCPPTRHPHRSHSTIVDTGHGDGLWCVPVIGGKSQLSCGDRCFTGVS